VRSGGRHGWNVFVVLALAVWLGLTFYIGATNDDPADSGPMRRTFVIGAALFTAALLGRQVLKARASAKDETEALYHELAIGPVDADGIRAARRNMRSVSYMYALFAGLATIPALVAIALAPEGPTMELAYVSFGIVAIAAVYMLYALRTIFRGATSWLEPLGLMVSETPKWVAYPRWPGGVQGTMVGALGFSGRRHGRDVAILQAPRAALTSIRGSFAKRDLDDSQVVAAVAGELEGSWRKVQVAAGPDGVTVHRRGNGAGAYMLQDLWLAERIADTS
jgi:hypothetical protein